MLSSGGGAFEKSTFAEGLHISIVNKNEISNIETVVDATYHCHKQHLLTIVLPLV